MKCFQSIVLLLVFLASCMGRLKERFEWKEIDYDYPSPEERQQAIDSGAFIPHHNFPMGLEVWGDKLFITIARWRFGVPASLNYIDLNDNSTSPKLIPYPSWAAHSDKDGKREIMAPYRVRADRCNRLWVLDSGHNPKKEWIGHKPAFLVYDLITDELLRRFEFPEDYTKPRSGYANIAVEDNDCEDTYAYASDCSIARIVVYSWKNNESRALTHPYYNADPAACNFDIGGYKFKWIDTVFGIALSAPKADNFSTLYFHPLSSYNEFSVSTEYLRGPTVPETNCGAFKKLGSRGPKTQSAASFLDKKTGVLFYTLIHLNAIGCWKTTNEEYTIDNQVRVFTNNETMLYPNDLKVDYNDELWVLSNKLPVWRYGTLDFDQVNFRVFSAPVADVIRGTACDV